MTNAAPKVSVVMPIYNAEPYLEQALDSVLAQTLADIEVVCVNDGSKDTSLETIQRYAANDSRIKVIDKPNGGYGHAMNVGINNAAGEYVGILEPDDYLKPEMFEKLYNRAVVDDLNFVRSDYYRLTTDANGMDHLEKEPICNKSSYYNKTLNPQANVDLFNIRMENWTGIYKRSWLIEHDIKFNESPGAGFQDNGFWFQTYCWANKIAVLDEAFYCYRQDNAASSINQSNKVFVMLDEYQWIENWLRSNPQLCQKFIGIFEYKKTHNCEFAFSRLANEFQLPFLERYASEYRRAFDNNEIDEKLFWPNEIKRLKRIVADPESYVIELRSGRSERTALEIAHEKGKLAVFSYFMKEEGIGSALKRAFSSIVR